jgi:DNA gyrase inhibitor GyrI
MASPLNIQIVRLDAMRIASAYGFGDSPEEVAWQNLARWAKPRGFLDNLSDHPVYGFNNPYPTPATPRYGYELWMKVGPEVEPENDVRIGEFFGGLYATTRCEVHGNPEKIPATWQSLAAWCKTNGYATGTHHALERYLSSPDDLASLMLELYCPILHMKQEPTQ